MSLKVITYLKKGNDDNDVSEEMEAVSINTIKNVTFLFSDQIETWHFLGKFVT